MDGLSQIVKREVFAYACDGWQMTDHSVANEEQTVFAVLAIPENPDERKAHIAVMAHIEGDYVVIDIDITDRPLSLALQEAGIPREKIVFAHMGRKLPAVVGD
jgi:hypothetical protein